MSADADLLRGVSLIGSQLRRRGLVGELRIDHPDQVVGHCQVEDLGSCRAQRGDCAAGGDVVVVVMESFNRAMALGLGPSGVRVNCIAPALVRSEIYLADGMDEQGFAKMMEEFGAKYLLGRVGEPEDVAELAAFLVSERAGWMTGAVLPVDSGYRSVGFKQQ